MAYFTALVFAAMAVWQTRMVSRRRAALGLLATAVIMLALAVFVSLQACHCSVPLRPETMPDVRFALAMAAGFGLAGVARWLLKSGA